MTCQRFFNEGARQEYFKVLAAEDDGEQAEAASSRSDRGDQSERADRAALVAAIGRRAREEVSACIKAAEGQRKTEKIRPQGKLEASPWLK